MYSKNIRRYIVIALSLGWGCTFIYYFLHARAPRPLSKQNHNQQSENIPKNMLYTEKRLLMGTFVEVTSPEKESLGIVFAEMERIERLLSKYKHDSEIFKLNRDGFIVASPQTYHVIKRAVEFYKNTNGAFDITIGPLMDLWGFTDKNYRVPSKEDIAKTLKLIGSDKIVLYDDSRLIQFKVAAMKIDLGGLAKGYALDCAAKKLKEAKISSCLINAGGQVYCLGEYFAKPWKIAILGKDKKTISKTLSLKDESVSTSGNYEQYFIKEGTSYGHILNPRSGYPVNADFSSATVIAQDALTADALSTALFVLGRTEGEKVISQYREVKFRIN